MSEIVHIPFRGDDLLAVEVNGKPHVAFKPIVFALGLDYSAALQRLKRQHWAATAVTTIPDGNRSVQQVVTVDVKTLLMFLATIQTSRVAEAMRPKLVAYQSEVADVIEAYWTRGHVANPRVRTKSLGPVTLDFQEAAAVMRQDYHAFGMDEYTLTRLLRSGGVLKKDGRVPRAKYEPMFWWTGTRWDIHQHAVPLLLRKAEDTGRELREFRFIQSRLEFEEVGHPELAA
jgi:hypothetical protein